MKLRDLNNLLVRGRARIWTWICFTPNPVCFTPQHTTNLGGARHGALGETERWALGGHVPWEPCSEGRMAPGWDTAPALATRVLHSYQLSSWEILHMSQGQFPLSVGRKSDQGAAPPTFWPEFWSDLRENCLMLCYRNHRRKLNQEGRACGAWNEWMNE